MNKYKEALNVVKKINLRSEYYVQFEENNIENVYEEEINILQELVDKETPKKPYYEGDGYADGVMVYDVARCPNCDNVFEEYENNGWGENYCHKCGQRLDWSDSE